GRAGGLRGVGGGGRPGPARPYRHVVFPDADVGTADRQGQAVVGLAQLLLSAFLLGDVDVQSFEEAQAAVFGKNAMAPRQDPLDVALAVEDPMLVLERFAAGPRLGPRTGPT